MAYLVVTRVHLLVINQLLQREFSSLWGLEISQGLQAHKKFDKHWLPSAKVTPPDNYHRSSILSHQVLYASRCSPLCPLQGNPVESSPQPLPSRLPTQPRGPKQLPTWAWLLSLLNVSWKRWNASEPCLVVGWCHCCKARVWASELELPPPPCSSPCHPACHRAYKRAAQQSCGVIVPKKWCFMLYEKRYLNRLSVISRQCNVLSFLQTEFAPRPIWLILGISLGAVVANNKIKSVLMLGLHFR